MADPTAFLNWYDALYSRTVDLVGDYAGDELFLIDGDSLLVQAFSDEQLDFYPGFQLLHATYLVENFLDALMRRKRHFHVVFFGESKELCVPWSAGSVPFATKNSITSKTCQWLFTLCCCQTHLFSRILQSRLRPICDMCNNACSRCWRVVRVKHLSFGVRWIPHGPGRPDELFTLIMSAGGGMKWPTDRSPVRISKFEYSSFHTPQVCPILDEDSGLSLKFAKSGPSHWNSRGYSFFD